MKKLHFYCLFTIVLSFTFLRSQAQELAQVHLTAEQEASNQTGRLRQALGLSSIQVKKIYDINLRYARLRQLSHSPVAEMELMKKKNIEIANLLTDPQCERFCEFIYSHNHSEQVRKTEKSAPVSGSQSGKKNVGKDVQGSSKKNDDSRVQKNDSSSCQVPDNVG